MSRFGRSDGRWGDRWGGGFVVAVVLLRAGAAWLGNYLAGWLGEAPASTEDPAGTAGEGILPGGQIGQWAGMGEYPKAFNVYFLQAHALRSQEKAAEAARSLEAMGVPAAVTHDGEWYKVIIGAYGSKDAADAAKASAEITTELPLYANHVTIPGDPPVLPVTAEAQTPYNQGVAALNSFMHLAAAWWDRYATAGIPDPADQVVYQAQQLEAVAQALAPYATDPAVSDLLRVTQLAVTTGRQMGQITPQMQPGDRAYQDAMRSYVTLVDTYRTWAGSGW